MTFTSPSFLVLMAIFFPLYAMTRGFPRLLVIFLTSVVFYGWWDWRFLFLIGTSITVDFFVAQAIHATQNPFGRKSLLLISLGVNLGILFFFKYFNFFLDSLHAIFTAADIPFPVGPLQLILPVGISFYTFQSLSYTISVYRQVMEPERSYIRYASYVMLFPQLLSGPIVRANKLLPQLRVDQPLRWKTFLSGMQLIVWGFFLKSVVADSLSKVVDNHFNAPDGYSSLGLSIAVVFYAFQIYGDFSGYSLIAIGLGEIMGFDLGRNFDRPYFSQSFSEFWQRWHISLSTWLRDFLYIPLGGNRHGEWMTYRNLMLTMLLGGLWHGASWNFVIWGALHGLYLVVQRLIAPTYNRLCESSRIPRWLLIPATMGFVFGLTCLTWIFFRANTLRDSLYIVQRIAIPDGLGIDSIRFKFETIKGLLVIALLVSAELLSFRVAMRAFFDRYPLAMIPAGAVTVWVIALLGTFGGNSFIYFQF